MENSEPSTVLTWCFEWDRGRGEVAALGGMLAPVWFRLENGQEVQPFAVASWADEDDTSSELPGILKRLRGEWPCVPFGMPEPPPELPDIWQPQNEAHSDFHVDPHGVSANFPWQLVAHFGTGIEIEFRYPEAHPIERLVRRIEGREGQTAVDISLQIYMRQDAWLPIGLHPVFSLPDAPGCCELEIPHAMAMAYPVETEPGVSRLLPGGVSDDISNMDALSGSQIDVSHLPLPGHTEELVQLAVKKGQAKLANKNDGYAVNLQWNEKQFPFCLLWISNKGRSAPPWNSRHLALGIEPVASAFDLGIKASRNGQNPLAAHGETTQQLTRSEPFSTTYSISISGL